MFQHISKRTVKFCENRDIQTDYQDLGSELGSVRWRTIRNKVNHGVINLSKQRNGRNLFERIYGGKKGFANRKILHFANSGNFLGAF
jgi:hypothetical protein